MKLECKIRRPGGSEVDLVVGDTTTPYHFKPLDPTRADSPHVAEVSDMTHLSRFIALAPENYVPFEVEAPKVDLPKPQANNAPQQASSKSLPEHPPAAQPDSAGQAGDTNNDGRLSIVELSSGIAANKFTPEALRELLAQEEESGEPRKGFVKVITQALK